MTLSNSGSTAFVDPKVGHWVLNPGDQKNDEKSLSWLTMTFKPDLSGMLQTLGSSKGNGSVAMSGNPAEQFRTAASPRSRAVAEVILARQIMLEIKTKLVQDGLYKIFKEVEMPSILSVAGMELNGFGFCNDESERQRKILLAKMEELEQEAYKLAKRPFSLTSPEDTSKVNFNQFGLVHFLI